MVLTRNRGGLIGRAALCPTAAELAIFARVGLTSEVSGAVVHVLESFDPANLESVPPFGYLHSVRCKDHERAASVRRGGFVFQAETPSSARKLSPSINVRPATLIIFNSPLFAIS